MSQMWLRGGGVREGGSGAGKPAAPLIASGGGGRGEGEGQTCPCDWLHSIHMQFSLPSLFLVSPFCCRSLSRYKKGSHGAEQVICHAWFWVNKYNIVKKFVFFQTEQSDVIFMYSRYVKRVFYSAFVRKCTDMCKHRFGVQLLQNPPLCSSTANILFGKWIVKDKLLWSHCFTFFLIWWYSTLPIFLHKCWIWNNWNLYLTRRRRPAHLNFYCISFYSTVCTKVLCTYAFSFSFLTVPAFFYQVKNATDEASIT